MASPSAVPECPPGGPMSESHSLLGIPAEEGAHDRRPWQRAANSQRIRLHTSMRCTRQTTTDSTREPTEEAGALAGSFFSTMLSPTLPLSASTCRKLPSPPLNIKTPPPPRAASPPSAPHAPFPAQALSHSPPHCPPVTSTATPAYLEIRYASTVCSLLYACHVLP